MNRFQFTPSLWLSLALCVLMLILGALPEVTEPLLQFDRQRIASGEWWRLLSGQLVHYGIYHLLMNVIALALCGLVLLRQLHVVPYLILFMISALGVGFGLFLFNPMLDYYTGLSGVLHGLIVAGLLLGLRDTPIFNVVALALVMGKLFQEQAVDFDTAHALLPVPVAVDAHLYGAIAGFVVALGLLLVSYLQQRPHTAIDIGDHDQDV